MDTKIILEILAFSAIPVISIIIGGTFGANFAVKPKIRSTLLHLAAGVIFAVVAIELLPEIMKNPNVTGVTVGFFLGLAVMMLIKYITRKSEKIHKQQIHNNETAATASKLLPWGLIIGIAVDIVIDGILLGVGFAAGESEGILLCVALSLEILVLGLVISTELKAEKIRKSQNLLIIIVLSLTFVIGAFIGSIMLSVISHDSLNAVLAFGLSALMYLVTEELLVEAHEDIDTPFSTAVFFVGFFVFLIIAM